MQFKLNGWTPCRISSNSMQSDAKVKKKKCASSYLMEDMILKSLLPFLPIISDSDEVRGHVILAKICYFWMILKICSTFYEIPSNAIKWIEMTIFSRKVFYLCRTRKLGELPKFARCTISSHWITFGATKSYLTSYLIAEKQPSRYL